MTFLTTRHSKLLIGIIATFVAIFIAIVPTNAYAAGNGYAVLDPSGTLTFLHSTAEHANDSIDSSGNHWYTVSDDGVVGYRRATDSISRQVHKVVFQDEFSPTSTENWFTGMSNLTEFDNPQNLNFSNVTNASIMFDDCSSLASLDVSSWDTSSLENASQMFRNCSSLTSLDVSGWDMSHVTTMQSMFAECSNLASLDLSNWNPLSVTTMRYMFMNCTNLNDDTVASMSNWNVSSLQDADSLFMLDNQITTVDFSGWGSTTANLQDIGYMFAQCDALQSVDLTGWNTQSLQNMSHTWYADSNMDGQPEGIDAWDTSSLTNLSNTFYNCNGIVDLSLPDWDTHNVTDMSDMLDYCYGLESADLTNWNTQNCADMTNALGMNNTDWANVRLQEITLGTGWSFKGSSTDPSKWAILETPTANQYMTGKWAEDDWYATNQYTPAQLQDYDNFNSEPHTWYWGLIGVTYSLTYDANGGTGAPDAETVDTDYLADNPTHDFVLSDQVPTRDGYTFVGWSDVQDPSSTDTLYQPGDTYTATAPESEHGESVTKDVTLYAQWRSYVTHELTFDGNGEGVSGVPTGLSQTVPYNQDVTFTLPASAPTRDGYTFGGWNTAADGSGDSYDPGAAFTSLASDPETTLYAQWNEIPAPDEPDGPDVPGDNPEDPFNPGGSVEPNAPEGSYPGGALGNFIVSIEDALGVSQPTEQENAEQIAETADPLHSLIAPFAGLTVASGCAALAFARKKRHQN